MLTNARTLTLISNSIYSSSPHVDLSHHLAAPFTSLEAKLAISQMNQNSAQTYIGSYAAAWETVAPKILEFVHGFAYGWAFGLPENFGSGFSGIQNFGFRKLQPEICWK